ncbi:Acer3 [Symbiodinium natans]|uniref:Acer3 protein n=1 Tax=Symbiodinium natans TaxID=878477 RepID=A0A812GQB6_9DINO|nr:Acer3 [Symbiodinium natans]
MALKHLQWVLAIVLVLILPLLALLVVRGPVDGTGDTTPGFWGAKTASVNWCERDYVVSFYIAEFANSVTSLCLVATGIYGIHAHVNLVELRYLLAFFSFVVIGLGSFAFHGTLLRSMQLLDEVPMVWANTVFIYICRSMKDARGSRRVGEGMVLAVLTVLATLAIAVFDTDNQNVFLLCYGSGVLYLVWRSYKFCRDSTSSTSWLLFITAMLSYAGGFLLWLADRNFCHSVRQLHLHVFWHFGADLGTFAAVLLWIWVRSEVLATKVVLRGRSPMTWRIAAAPQD